MRRISKGNETLVIGTAQEKKLQEPLSFESHENAVQCLRSYLTDPYNTAILRKILYESSLNCTVCSLTDLEVVSQVARMVVQGQVVVALEKPLAVAGGSRGVKETELAEGKKWDKEAYVAGFLAENAVTPAKIADDKIDEAVKDSGAEFEKKGVVKGKNTRRQKAESKSDLASIEQATQLFKNGPLTNVGRALTKHPNIIDESGNILQKLGGAANVNKAGEKALQNIMQNGTMGTKMTKAFGQVIEYKLPSGLGARFSAETGEFIGFLGRGL
jgi:hypothetical protein